MREYVGIEHAEQRPCFVIQGLIGRIIRQHARQEDVAHQIVIAMQRPNRPVLNEEQRGTYRGASDPPAIRLTDDVVIAAPKAIRQYRRDRKHEFKSI